MTDNSRTLKVAAIQSVSTTGDATENLARATRLVAETAAHAKARPARLNAIAALRHAQPASSTAPRPTQTLEAPAQD